MSDELERHLQAARQGGSTDSSGSFSLNSARAKALLGELQLPQLELYLLKLVQAAVRGGAAKIEITTEHDRMTFSHDGRVEGLHHFQIGVAALSTLLDRELRFRDCRQLQIPRGPGRWSWGRGLPEIALLKERCRYCPIPLLLDGKAVNRPFFGKKNDANYDGVLRLGPPPKLGPVTLLLAAHDDGSLLLAPHLTAEERRWVVHDLSQQEESEAAAAEQPSMLMDGRPMQRCHAMLRRIRDSWSSLSWVLDGVVLVSERNVLDRPGLEAIVSAGELKTDLSEFGVIHDDTFFRITNRLRRQVLWMY